MNAMSAQTVLPRRVEVLAGLSVAIDLGLGQPVEHMLRSAVIATRLARRLGLDRSAQDTVYYATLVMWIGCHADSAEYARWFGDDIAVRRDAYLVDWSGLPYLRFLLGNLGRGESLPHRMKTMAELFRDARGQITTLVHSHCLSAAALAGHIGLGADVERAILYTFERFDGGGMPAGVSGTEIPVEMRVAQLADMAEVHHRMYGFEGAIAMARSRRGGHFDPAVVDAFVIDPEALFPDDADDPWDLALSIAPDAEVRLDDAGLDRLLLAIGDFVDLKCPFALGHSRGVADLAEAAAGHLGLDQQEVDAVRRAGYLHDVGRIGVSSRIWSKSDDLTSAEWERVRMHPYLTDRVLTRITGLGDVAKIARSHHEHLDGTGYPLGLTSQALGRPDRILAAALAYRSAIEPRPYREAMTTRQAADRLVRRADRGELDTDCVEAVLTAAGQTTGRTRRTDALTPREREILGLVARGLSNREIASKLVLSEKTVRNHVERTYAKVGVSNRVGASLYALQNGLAFGD
ncbi:MULTISPECIES: HD domain-containing phosphohydrolase [Gordonia]|uniref:HD domain-containing phosphohydrolase n=1 Tax=Gordonia TaxID=2053 RepID=UPI0004014695|nr:MULTISPECIES: HD domain-containing phosphohydrolase [Gordonia]KAF0967763.1 3'3'-cGAMP-specific phosphodiesterase 3 [Gordonia sp. YY1]MCR8896572.1 LuxR C-terminal-related transcriptional regulator [Gordonia sp. GONU]MCZ0913859.1 LuxR C-terminal-related transcriptional regulator [Gordonia amicalis]MCZ4650435.1 LuxR C-terminal-related transcriptional regulator [Gordonia amicalis]